MSWFGLYSCPAPSANSIYGARATVRPPYTWYQSLTDWPNTKVPTVFFDGAGDVQLAGFAARSGVKRTSIYYFIDRLVELGLIDQAEIRGRTHYKARPPENIIELQKRRLAELEQALPEFLSLYNVSTKKPKISYFEGPVQMQQIMLEEWKSHEVLWIWPTEQVVEMVGGSELMGKIVQRDIELGIHLRAIRFRGQAAEWGGAKHGEMANRDLRFAPASMDIPMAIGIFDTGKVGFLTSRKEGFGILIESLELYQTMKMLFEVFWAQSEPAKLGEG